MTATALNNDSKYLPNSIHYGKLTHMVGMELIDHRDSEIHSWLATEPEELGREIVVRLRLSERDKVQMEMHSIINIATIAYAELALVTTLLNDPQALEDCMNWVYDFGQKMKDVAKALPYLANVESLQKAVIGDVIQAADGLESEAKINQLEQSLNNLRSIFAILTVRAAEMIERASIGKAWVAHSITDLSRNMRNMLGAIETNSKGRYGVVYDAALQTERDYLVHLDIYSVGSELIVMPPVLQDVMRDMTLNARKYTDPGGTISTILGNDSCGLHLMVEDTGWGIPTDEIDEVVQQGVRGSNVRNVKSNGGGLGLTKAYIVAQQFGGRMWIKSELGMGTRITIAIPKP